MNPDCTKSLSHSCKPAHSGSGTVDVSALQQQCRFGILTVSDRCSRGEASDKSGEGLATCIETEKNGVVVLRSCVPDEISNISSVLMEWCDRGLVDVILTTGGTGFSPRDVTPEATKSVIEKEAPGLAMAMVQGSLAITPMAMLSRAICGVRSRSLIINLPGSAKGSLESYRIVAKQIKHAVDLLRGDEASVTAQHKVIQAISSATASIPTSATVRATKVDATNIAGRARKSPYPTVEVPKAQQIVLNECFALIADSISLKNGLGYILAQDVFARDPLPPFPASIKDGYALRVLENSPPIETLNVLGNSTAGEHPEKFKVEAGFCIRISTGAPVPAGANAVIQIEDTELIERTPDGKEEKTIRILKQTRIGQDIRQIGSDIQENEKVLFKGSRLGPPELGILAAVGVSKFMVYKKPRVALLSTGNELISPYEPLEKGKGKIRDSNKTTLNAVFTEGGFQTHDIGIAKDTPQDVLGKLIEGMGVADIIVSTGGVSMGERDYLKEVLINDLNATIHFGSVLMKPGKPTTFASCDFNGIKKLIFGLPGNPVSATVTAHLFVIPACRKLCGWPNPFYTTVKVKLQDNLKLDKTRPEYHRTTINWNSVDTDGYPVGKSTGNQISSRLMSCNSANALLVLPQGTDAISEISPGSIVDAYLISSA